MPGIPGLRVSGIEAARRQLRSSAATLTSRARSRSPRSASSYFLQQTVDAIDEEANAVTLNVGPGQ
ncbi:hypothetical protein [Streptomyces kronopolitis]|uniref:hypothetical protein n=1 Tax=Streptomyces kronopolitis TaxID=1612435 RepID=UPI0020BEE00E|nr:hypothetical protein [Streptomyces kronopolitis]MCL6302814.1 hypothetical protein [Streptomyces kronopolitis]